MGICAFVSFRLGLTDGVSTVARLWEQSVQELGWETMSVAGEGPVDVVIPALGIGPGLEVTASSDPSASGENLQTEMVAALSSALASADVVIAENILSIPLNLAASRALAEVLGGRAALLHHHDPPWQRDRFAHITELPPDDPAWRHVTINKMTERQFAARGLQATTIYNGFDVAPEQGDRIGTRQRLEVADDQLLFVHPVRAIARKNVPSAIRLAEQFDAVYWLPGPAEEGYEATLETLVARADCRVIRTPLSDDRSVTDLYAAADLVVFPSTWEGFGNPPVEAAIHGRPAVVGRYPVADELRSLGFNWPYPEDTRAIEMMLDDQRSMVDGDLSPGVAHNRSVAYRHLAQQATTDSIARLFQQAKWEP